MIKHEIKQIEIGHHKFDGVRVTDEDFPHFIELREMGSEHARARVNYYGPDMEITIETFGGDLPRSVVEWLLERAERRWLKLPLPTYAITAQRSLDRCFRPSHLSNRR
ncbi:hypothetical protein M9978_22670 [Sphingomonas sp. MG17]|uniref:Uncharacterized protein n=1 Tax=Sphingomonas tagetis TaxID=2949092 RepID=A0A9X2KNU8_9SPHN|nr:hypothetical protein [Sphingomonas tagetis]MCP3733212.1 hypothetical protein [Sphingomonas tagetis]